MYDHIKVSIPLLIIALLFFVLLNWSSKRELLLTYSVNVAVEMTAICYCGTQSLFNNHLGTMLDLPCFSIQKQMWLGLPPSWGHHFFLKKIPFVEM